MVVRPSDDATASRRSGAEASKYIDQAAREVDRSGTSTLHGAVRSCALMSFPRPMPRASAATNQAPKPASRCVTMIYE